MQTIEQTGAATYCPEDNKLRLYVGRVPRDEYLRLRDEGWTSTPKQRENGGCDFVATWTPERRNTALQYGGGIIEDEDQTPEERAADRAERFAGYRDKRTVEAVGHADRYDAGPQAHGYQSQARAERAAARHDRIADRAGDAWEKAEYWTRRTAGVISHALYKSLPAVRMGRIKELEAAIRKAEADRAKYGETFKRWQAIAAITDPAEQTKAALEWCGVWNSWSEYPHPRPQDVAAAINATGHPRAAEMSDLYTTRKTSLYTLLTAEYAPITGAEACALYFSNHSELAGEGPWLTHYRLRLAYETQMMEAQGGRAAFVEMQVGGWLGNRQIRKVNKSPATGRVVSVTLKIPGDRWGNSKEGFHLRAFNVERLPADSYRPPTPEDVEALKETKKAEKESGPQLPPCPLINPTDADAEKLQAIWNEAGKRDRENASKPLRMTQADYSLLSAGTYGSCKTVVICERGTPHSTKWGQNITRADVFKVRLAKGRYGEVDRVVVLTDKAQKPLPFGQMQAALAACPSPDKLRPQLGEIAALLSKGFHSEIAQLLRDAEYVGWVSIRSMSQISWTDKGNEEWKAAGMPRAETVNA